MTVCIMPSTYFLRLIIPMYDFDARSFLIGFILLSNFTEKFYNAKAKYKNTDIRTNNPPKIIVALTVTSNLSATKI